MSYHTTIGDSATGKDRNLFYFKQHLLKQYGQRNISDMSAGFTAFQDQSVDTVLNLLAGNAFFRRE